MTAIPAEAIAFPDASMDDDALVTAARRGDRAAISQLYRRFAPVIHATLITRTRPADVDDLVHDVFLEAIRRLETLRDAGAFGAWVGTIARRRAIDLARRNARRAVTLADAPEPVDSGAAPALTAERVLEAIRALPGAYRETLALRLIEGLTGPEIARRTGRSHDAVRVNLHRGMHQLRRLLSEDQP